MGCTVYDELCVFMFVGWSTQCLMDWGRFARIAIPGMLMVCLEWWGFEIGVFLSGLLGPSTWVRSQWCCRSTPSGSRSVTVKPLICGQTSNLWPVQLHSQTSNIRPVQLHSQTSNLWPVQLHSQTSNIRPVQLHSQSSNLWPGQLHSQTSNLWPGQLHSKTSN